MFEVERDRGVTLDRNLKIYPSSTNNIDLKTFTILPNFYNNIFICIIKIKLTS